MKLKIAGLVLLMAAVVFLAGFKIPGIPTEIGKALQVGLAEEVKVKIIHSSTGAITER